VNSCAKILAQACNFGLTRMAQISDLDYEQLAWCTTWHLREETLRAANDRVVNAPMMPSKAGAKAATSNFCSAEVRT
jgi:hypothetical protein